MLRGNPDSQTHCARPLGPVREEAVLEDKSPGGKVRALEPDTFVGVQEDAHGTITNGGCQSSSQAWPRRS